MTLREALSEAARRIDMADARVLMMHTAHTDAAGLIQKYRDALTPEEEETFFFMVRRCEAGEPPAYITGKRGFYGLDFIVTPDVLIPRAETELLVERALEHIPADAPCRVLDLCTGSGCVGLTVAHERPRARVTLCDVSEAALRVAKRNADALGIDAKLILGDVRTLELSGESFDVILSNPPYIKTGYRDSLEPRVRDFEPSLALFGGEDGLMFYRVIIRRFREALSPDGVMIFESGDESGGAEICESIVKIFNENGYKDARVYPDYSGNMRIILARRVTEKI
ncbi:MAG: peptide chain release factor N(5)-glutamine methyltransferase [Clostridia bacterium]|nr:peptide chain release factor N(5)-glutamine methyltransferase [Clostridia bacterium]